MCAKERVTVLVGQNLRRIREGKGMSQERLAFSVECETGYISMIERGKRSPSLTILCKLSEALNIHIKDLFEE